MASHGALGIAIIICVTFGSVFALFCITYFCCNCFGKLEIINEPSEPDDSHKTILSANRRGSSYSIAAYRPFVSKDAPHNVKLKTVYHPFVTRTRPGPDQLLEV